MPKILIVDDEQAIRNMYGDKFKTAGFEVDLTSDGESALQKITDSPPDIVLLDILMPQMDGMRTMKHIRQLPNGANIPIIMLTNLDSNDEILDGVIKDHPAYYLVKVNTTPDDVLEKVKTVLKL